MNIDEFEAELSKFENEGPAFLSPCSYAKIRPVSGPQVYGWIRTGQLNSKYCDCGRKVINVAEADDLLRQKGKLPNLRTEEQDEDQDDVGRDD
jgi:hypothetical protein